MTCGGERAPIAPEGHKNVARSEVRRRRTSSWITTELKTSSVVPPRPALPDAEGQGGRKGTRDQTGGSVRRLPPLACGGGLHPRLHSWAPLGPRSRAPLPPVALHTCRQGRTKPVRGFSSPPPQVDGIRTPKKPKSRYASSLTGLPALRSCRTSKPFLNFLAPLVPFRGQSRSHLPSGPLNCREEAQKTQEVRACWAFVSLGARRTL